MQPSRSYQVALSFAGAQRDYVEQVAVALQALDVGVFYDEFDTHDLWGENLYTHLDSVYRTSSDVVVMFVSTEYRDRAWTSHERASAQARALEEDRPYILPVRFDDAEIPGLLPTVHYLDARRVDPSEIAAATVKKLSTMDLRDASSKVSTDGAERPWPATWSRTTVQQLRPEGWEYLLFFVVVTEGVKRLRPERMMFDGSAVLPDPAFLDLQASAQTIRAEFAALERITASIEPIVNQLLLKAFGAEGESGDPELIIHCGEQAVAAYGAMIDWSRRLRSYNFPSELIQAVNIIGQMPRQSLDAFEEWAGEFQDLSDRWIELMESRNHGAKPLMITLELILTIDPALTDALSKELKAVGRRI